MFDFDWLKKIGISGACMLTDKGVDCYACKLSYINYAIRTVESKSAPTCQAQELGCSAARLPAAPGVA